jgi:hypothetical protein
VGRFLKAFGAFLATTSGVVACTLFAAAMLVETRFIGRLAWVGVVFWVALGLVGLRLRRVGREQEEEREAARYKRAVADLARRQRGRVTALELASALGIDVERARAFLDLLVGLGEATPELSPEMLRYYQIGPTEPDLIPPPPPPPPPRPAAIVPPRPPRTPGAEHA